MSMLFSQEDVTERYGREQWTKGMEKGMENGIITSIKNIMKNMNVSLEKAMDVLQISGDDRRKYAGLLGV